MAVDGAAFSGGTRGNRPIRGVSKAAVALALAACALAFWHHRTLTAELAWPAFDTQFREMSSAQTLIDEGPNVDATYLGETPWYNPMAASVLSAVHQASGVALRELVPRLGTYVNLLGPLAFFFAVALLIDSWTAFAALVAYLFITPNHMTLGFAAGYSPWLTPENMAQPFFYAGLYAAYHLGRRPRRHDFAVATGVLLGMTFLAHTAAAAVLGTVIVIALLQQRYDAVPYRELAARLALVLATAFVMSLPYARSILFNYHLRVVNQYPGTSPATILDLNEQPALLRLLLFGSPLLWAAVGLGAYLVATERRSGSRRIVVAWIAGVAMLLVAHDARLLLRKAGVSVPSVVPAHHFLYHFMTLVSVGCGIAATRLAVWLARPFVAQPRMRRAVATLTVTFAAAAALVCRGDYLNQPEFAMHAEAQVLANRIPAPFYDWLRSATAPGDVFLCSDELSLFVVNPAGRKVVATNKFFSSPYVDWEVRDRERDAMLGALGSGGFAEFHRLAAKYRVRYVALRTVSDPTLLRLAGVAPHKVPPVDPARLHGAAGLRQVFAGGGVLVFAVEPAGSSAATQARNGGAA